MDKKPEIIKHPVYLISLVISMFLVVVALMADSYNLMIFSVIFFYLMMYICIYSGIRDLLSILAKKKEPSL